MIFYTNYLIPARFAACTRGPVILIRPQYRYDEGLLAHEKVHRRQWLRTLGLHSFLYLFSKRYRLRSEIEAYKVQLEYSPEKITVFAWYLVGDYGLDITMQDALSLLETPKRN